MGDNEKLASYQSSLVAESAIDEMPIALIRKVDVDRIELTLNLLLRNLRFRFSKLNNLFDEYEIPAIMDGILKQYYYLTLEEIAYVFNKIIIGTYKLSYNKLDASAVFDCLHIYDSKERIAIAERRDANKNEEFIKLTQDTFKHVSSEFVKEMVKKIADQNNLITVDSLKEKEILFKQERSRILASKTRGIDEDGNEVTF